MVGFRQTLSRYCIALVSAAVNRYLIACPVLFSPLAPLSGPSLARPTGESTTLTLQRDAERKESENATGVALIALATVQDWAGSAQGPDPGTDAKSISCWSGAASEG